MVSSVDGSNWIETFFHQQESIKRMLSPGSPLLAPQVLFWSGSPSSSVLFALNWLGGKRRERWKIWELISSGRHCRCQQTELFQPKQYTKLSYALDLGTESCLGWDGCDSGDVHRVLSFGDFSACHFHRNQTPYCCAFVCCFLLLSSSVELIKLRNLRTAWRK